MGAWRRPEVAALLAPDRKVRAVTARVATGLGGDPPLAELARMLAQVVAAAATGYPRVVLRALRDRAAAPPGFGAHNEHMFAQAAESVSPILAKTAACLVAGRSAIVCRD